tara:strand:+ start:132 stop:500 length:369 start_codon:yes stop_codon:yes gene_type:complete
MADIDEEDVQLEANEDAEFTDDDEEDLEDEEDLDDDKKKARKDTKKVSKKVTKKGSKKVVKSTKKVVLHKHTNIPVKKSGQKCPKGQHKIFKNLGSKKKILGGKKKGQNLPEYAIVCAKDKK